MSDVTAPIDRLISPAELLPRRPQPPQADIDRALRDVPVALERSRFAGPSFRPADPHDHSILLSAWLAFAQERGNGRAAADWAVYRLAEAGRVSVIWPALYQYLTADKLVEWFAGIASRLRGGRPLTVTDWDLAEAGRVLEIRSTPALWEWFRAGCPITESKSEEEPPATTASQSARAKKSEGETPAEVVLPALLSAPDIAKRIGRSRSSVTSFLTRYAEDCPDCRTQTTSRRKNEPGYLYRVADVWPALEKWMKDNGSH